MEAVIVILKYVDSGNFIVRLHTWGLLTRSQRGPNVDICGLVRI